MWLLTTFLTNNSVNLSISDFTGKTSSGHVSGDVNRALKHGLFCAYVLCIPYRLHLPLRVEFRSKLNLVTVLRTNRHR